MLDTKSIQEKALLVALNKTAIVPEMLDNNSFQEKALLVALNKTAIVAETEINGIISFANDKFLEVSGYSRDKIIGKTFQVINSGIHPKNFMEDLWKTIKGGEVWRGEICNKSKFGEIYWADTFIVPILDDQNKIIKFIAFYFDITAKKKLSEKLLLESHRNNLAVLGQLAATVAHEINNSIAGISMFTQMMESDLPKNSPFQEHIAVIKHYTESCAKTVQVLLNQSRRSKLEMIELDLSKILEEFVVFFKPLCQKSNVVLKQNLGAIFTQVWGDPVQLRNVFVNLLMNALQCFEGKEGTVILRSINSFDYKWVIVEIEDNGPGIPEEARSKIFEPFFTTKKLGQGTGLGLSNATDIIQAHGGKLVLVKPEKSQTIFRVEIPISKELKSNG